MAENASRKTKVSGDWLSAPVADHRVFMVQAFRFPEDATPPPDEASPYDLLRRRLTAHRLRDLFAASPNPEADGQGVEPLLRAPTFEIAGCVPEDLPNREDVLAKRRATAEEDRARFADTVGDAPVWVGEDAVSGDRRFVVDQGLHEHVAELLLGRPEFRGKGFYAGDAPLALSNEALAMLAGHFKTNHARGLAFAVSGSALKRLGARGVASPLASDDGAGTLWPVHIVNGWLLFSGLGLLLMIIEVSYRRAGRKTETPPCLLQIAESTYELTRWRGDTPIHWLGAEAVPVGDAGAAPAAGPPLAANSFRDLLLALLPDEIRAIAEGAPAFGPPPVRRAGDPHQLFHYSAVQLATGPEAVDERETWALRLARRYNDRYLLHGIRTEARVMTPFAGVSHAMAYEGGATLIDPQAGSAEPVPFLTAFLRDPLKKAYLPLALMNYAEYLHLIRLSDEASMPIDFRNPSERDEGAMERFRHRVLSFRLNFRYSAAGYTSMHNDFHFRWREALGLNRVLEEVSQDVAEIDRFLHERLDQRRDAAYRAERDRRETAQKRLEIGLGLIGAVVGVASLIGIVPILQDWFF